jgi:hypothetical protein
MTPFNEFVQSVQGSFAANRATSLTRLALLLVAAAVAWWAISVWRRRSGARREMAARIRAVVAGRLSAADLEDLARIAAAGELPMIDVMTVLAQFEHATGRLLAQEPPTIRPALGSWFERVRHLRRALGFSPLSAHLWLLSTRELVVGDSVVLGASPGRVAEVNEASFAVDWPATVVLVPDTNLSVTIDRPDDARYVSRVRVLGVDMLPASRESDGRPAGVRGFFAHDEQPERQQDREYLRLRISAPVRVQISDPPAAAGATGPTAVPPLGPVPLIAGTIVDVSAGGLSLNLPVPPSGLLVRGRHVHCWFALDDQANFEALPAVIVAADPVKGPPPGQQHLRLAFVSLHERDRDRLVAAVARLQGGTSVSAGAVKG